MIILILAGIVILLVATVGYLVQQSKLRSLLELERTKLTESQAEMQILRRVNTLLTDETNHYKNLVESANELIFRSDLDGFFTYSNTIALKTWDLEENELLGKRYLDYVREDYRRKTEKFFFRQFLSGEQTTYFEYPVITRHGKEIWLGQNTQLLVDNGKTIGFQAVAREITEMKEIQKQLIESKEMYQSFFSVLQEGVVVHDADGVLISANSSAEKILGLTLEQMRQLPTLDAAWRTIEQDGTALPVEKHPALMTLTTGEPQSDVIMGVYKADNSLIWISVNSQPLFQNGSPTPTGVVVSFIDITNRKLAQQELQHAKANIDAWLDNTNDAVWSVDRNFSLLMFNRYYSITCQLTGGFQPKIKESAFRGMSEDIMLYAKELYSRALQGEHFSVEQGLEIGGSFQYFEIAFNPIHAGDTIVGVAALGKNITARKYSEQQLRDTLHLQQAIVNGAEYMIIATDTEGIITIFNPAAERALGYSAEELIGQKAPDVFHIAEEVIRRADLLREELGVDVPIGFETFVAKAKLGTPDENEWTYVHRSGRTFPVLLSVTATRNSEGEINGYLGIAKDISEQKKSREEVDRRDRLLEGISQSLQYLITADNLEVRIQEIISIIGSTSQADGVFLYRFSEIDAHHRSSELTYKWTSTDSMTRYPLIELNGTGGVALYKDLSAGNSINVFDEEFEHRGLSEFSSAGVCSLMTVPIILHDTLWGAIMPFDIHQRRIWAEWEKSILSSVAASIAGAIERWENQQKLHKFAEDIVQAKLYLEEQAYNLERQNEELLIAREAADEANRAKSAFLSNMSHELRTPLNSILGFTQILQKDKSLSEQSKNYIGMMYRSGNHLLEMINDVLDISKIESGYMEIVSETFDMQDLLSDVRGMFTLRCKDKGLYLTIEHIGFDSTMISSDRKRLKQVLINFISNAVKFTPSGGVEVRVQKLHDISINTEHSTALVRFSIRDTGRGIPDDQLATVFQPFKQVSGMYSDGTGLGLSISSRIVEMFGGKIQVESTIDIGTRFWFDLPLTFVHTQSESIAAEEVNYIGIKGDRTPSVLIVDDIATNREVARAFLEPLGFLCAEASNGTLCLQLLPKFRPDIILMDVLMPEMNGDEATKMIRMNEDFKEIPIIAVTASGFDGKREELMRIGFNDYLRKPFLEKELIEIIEKHLALEFSTEVRRADTADMADADALTTQEIVTMIRDLPDNDGATLLEAIEFQDFDTIGDIAVRLEHDNRYQTLAAVLSKAVKFSDYKLLVSIEQYTSSLS